MVWVIMRPRGSPQNAGVLVVLVRTALTMNMLCTWYNTERWSSWLPYCHWRLGRLSLGLLLLWICYVHATTQRGGPVDCLIVTGDLEGCHYDCSYYEYVMYMLEHREVVQLTALLSLETWKAVIRTALTMNMLCTCYNTERWSKWLPYCHWRLGRLSLGLLLLWICYVHATTYVSLQIVHPLLQSAPTGIVLVLCISLSVCRF